MADAALPLSMTTKVRYNVEFDLGNPSAPFGGSRGIENMPAAFLRLLKGQNFGKQLVKSREAAARKRPSFRCVSAFRRRGF
jgi:hypothetical protein